MVAFVFGSNKYMEQTHIQASIYSICSEPP